jgi:hypothetical protein
MAYQNISNKELADLSTEYTKQSATQDTDLQLKK